MADIIDFEGRKREILLRDQAHTNGPGICLGCGYTCEVVMLAGEQETQCPKCELYKLVRHGVVIPDDAWECGHCAGIFFCIRDEEMVCVNCGGATPREP